MAAVVAMVMTTVVACGDSAEDTAQGVTTSTTTATSATSTDDELVAWRADITAFCDRIVEQFSAIPEPAPDDGDGFAAFVAAHRSLQGERALAPEPPPGLAIDAEQVAVHVDAADQALTAAAASLAAQDLDGARAAMDTYFPHLFAIASLYAVAGASCGDATPDRAEAATLNVPLDFVPLILTAGFGSLWITEELGHRVARLDAATGELLAMIDVGPEPIKLQPADGRMWGRTTDTIFAIDPATNTVTATLAKTDVGPAADRAWAVDGALWICDGQRLHRYDPTTAQPVAIVELGVPCDAPGGTTELVVTSTFNDDDGESGTSVAAFVDPATNTLLATLPLPVDVGIGVVLDDVVFFPGQHGSTAVVVDRATWTIVATPDLGRPTFMGTAETDGRHIYLSTADHHDVLVVDTTTYTVGDTIHTLGTHAVTLTDGSLWVTDPDSGLAQRFDLQP